MLRRLAFIASPRPEAGELCRTLRRLYGDVPPAEAEALVVVGGDGTLLKTMRAYGPRVPAAASDSGSDSGPDSSSGRAGDQRQNAPPPIYGIRCGSVGFLMNPYRPDAALPELLARARGYRAHPLLVRARSEDTTQATQAAYAYNEVSIVRTSALAAYFRVAVDQQVLVERLTCDGVLVATPLGSTGYNLAAGGTRLPLGARRLVLTPICPFRPLGWEGSVLDDTAVIELRVDQTPYRPVRLAADNQILEGLSTHFEIRLDRTQGAELLFDAWPETPQEEQI